MNQLRVLLLPLDGMLVHRRVTLSMMSLVPIYTPGWRETMWGKVSHNVSGNNTMARTVHWTTDLQIWTAMCQPLHRCAPTVLTVQNLKVSLLLVLSCHNSPTYVEIHYIAPGHQDIGLPGNPQLHVHLSWFPGLFMTSGWIVISVAINQNKILKLNFTLLWWAIPGEWVHKLARGSVPSWRSQHC